MWATVCVCGGVGFMGNVVAATEEEEGLGERRRKKKSLEKGKQGTMKGDFSGEGANGNPLTPNYFITSRKDAFAPHVTCTSIGLRHTKK